MATDPIYGPGLDGQVVKYKHMLIQAHQNSDMTISQLRQYAIASGEEGERAMRHCTNSEYAELEEVARQDHEDGLRACRALRQLEVQAQLDDEWRATKTQRRWVLVARRSSSSWACTSSWRKALQARRTSS